MDEARALKDKDGIALPDALKKVGIDFERVKESGKELKNAAAYLELHIEQGPVLLDLDPSAWGGLGTFGVGAPCDYFSRPGRTFGQHANEPAERRLSCSRQR